MPNDFISANFMATTRRQSRHRGLLCLAAAALSAPMACQPDFAPPDAVSSPTRQADQPPGPPAQSPRGQDHATQASPATLEGELTLAPALAHKVAVGDTLFIVAREGGTGRIVAVGRQVLTQTTTWPVPFLLEDARLVAGMQVLLSARVDKDGDATSKQPGDCTAQHSGTVMVPKRGLRLQFDHVL